jgi:hypothetical protein
MIPDAAWEKDSGGQDFCSDSALARRWTFGRPEVAMSRFRGIFRLFGLFSAHKWQVMFAVWLRERKA